MEEKKKKYFAPAVKRIFVEMESGIAASSARTTTTDNTGAIQEEWKDLPEDNREIIF